MSQILGNKILRFVTLSMLCIILTDCGLPYCEKTRFTEEDLEWTTPYNVGDTLVMVNSRASYKDTIVIESVSVENPRNTFLFDLAGCNWMEGDNSFNAIALCTFELIHESEKFNCTFTIQKNHSNQPAVVTMYVLGNLTYYNPEPISNARPIKIGNKRMFKEALLIEKNRFSPSEYYEQIPLDYIIWDKRKGLVAYKLTEDSAPYVLKE